MRGTLCDYILITLAGASPSDMYSDPSPSSPGLSRGEARVKTGCPVAKVGGADWVELCNEWVDPWPDWVGPFF